jgi:hypothetical protein
MLNPICFTCSKLFTIITPGAIGKQKRFCSDACSDAWWNEQPQHPVIPKVDAQHPRALELKLKRTQLVLLEKADPYTYGYIPDHWEIANAQYGATQELLVSGGNRAGKTLWAARRVVQTLLEKENASVLCCHTSHATSVTVQQPAIYNYLPVALRATKKGRIHYLNYSRKNGFTDGSFILPNGSRCDFLNYTQSENTIEGREADLMVSTDYKAGQAPRDADTARGRGQCVQGVHRGSVGEGVGLWGAIGRQAGPAYVACGQGAQGHGAAVD